jgi:ribosomal protein L40E
MHKTASAARIGQEMPRSDCCMRCGIALPPGMSVCRRCNPAGLPSPSPSQYHATVFVSVLIAMVVIALLLAFKG